jgi:hypothetical protein
MAVCMVLLIEQIFRTRQTLQISRKARRMTIIYNMYRDNKILNDNNNTPIINNILRHKTCVCEVVVGFC